MDADPQVQLRLLDLQELDSGIDRLAVRRRSLPELAEIDRLTARLRQLAGELETAEARQHETARAQTRLEADVDNVRSRAVRDQGRLDSGAISSPRELENLQSEIASLNRRRDALEDELLELMEAAENAANAADALIAERAQLEADRAAAIERRDAQWAAIDEDSAQHQAARAELAPQLPTDLVTLYERIGVGGGHRCGAHLSPALRGLPHGAVRRRPVRGAGGSRRSGCCGTRNAAESSYVPKKVACECAGEARSRGRRRLPR